MSEKRRKQIVYTIFGLAVVWAIFNFPHKRMAVGPDMAPATETASLATASTTSPEASRPATLPAEWGRDPFARGQARAASAADVGQPNLRVAAVSMSGNGALAMINGKMMGRGDEVEGWRVVNISNAGVTVESNGKRITLKIGGE
jgi:hypothetical protein